MRSGRFIPQELFRHIWRAARAGVAGAPTTPADVEYMTRCSHYHPRTGTIICFHRETTFWAEAGLATPAEPDMRIMLTVSFVTPMPACRDHELRAANVDPGAGDGLFVFDEGVSRRRLNAALAEVWAHLLFGPMMKLTYVRTHFAPPNFEAVAFAVFVGGRDHRPKDVSEQWGSAMLETGWRPWALVRDMRRADEQRHTPGHG